MSRRLLPATLLGWLACVALPAAARAQQQTYPLRCNLRTTEMMLSDQGFRMRFTGASTGYQSSGGPATGECAWADRGWLEDEPTTLVWFSETRLIDWVFVDQDNRVIGLAGANQASEDDRTTLDKIFRAWKTGGWILVEAYRDGNVMRLTRVRGVGTVQE